MRGTSKSRYPQGHVVWDNFMSNLSILDQSTLNTPETAETKSGSNSNDLSYLFDNAKFDMCGELNDYCPTLSLDLKRIQTNNDKLEIPQFKYKDFTVETNNVTTQTFSTTYDPGDGNPLCSTPQGKEISLFDVTRDGIKPRQLFDDSFSFVVNESFLKLLDVSEEHGNPEESGETSSSLSNSLSNSDLVTMDNNQNLLLEHTTDASLLSDSFWITAGQIAEVDVKTKS
ncbi:hypothetical protein LOD99_1637 [Oopsacas minuta]|uniref:Uncharacterized protein n=1 Tax=Oopsacas minuta TaxID=111878 RepID=A0AAV7K3U3_9METZ|nr:hypothetical protein LOD99_1637 [Oopsacas minuta]